MTLEETRRVHFVGIGGAGMSAIAKVLVERGYEVSGSDLKRSRAARMLEAMGVGLTIGHRADLVEGAGLVVVSSAIPAANPELRRARELDLEVLGRGEALAALLADLRSIVVAGTHGKTTTTSMIVTVLHEGGADPTYLVGGGLNDSGTNARFGRDDMAVAESDESDGSFLLLSPHIGVVTNVEADHLDHWGSLDAIFEAFGLFARGVSSEGTLVVPATLEALGAEASADVTTFGEGGELTATEVRALAGAMAFTLSTGGETAPVSLRVPGLHNVSNATAAAAACLAAGMSLGDVARGLGEYRGVERRFQTKGAAGGITVIDDYAHHPTEVRMTLEAARAALTGRIVAVFQPHRYSRTGALHREFGASFDAADRVVITDVYGAGEQPTPGVSGKLVADSVCSHLPGRPVAYLPHRAELVAFLGATCRAGDTVLTLGAGDITSLGRELLAHLGGSG